MKLKDEILLARGRNWARLIAEKTNRICEERKNDVDLMIKILNGDIYNEAQNEIAHEIKTGKLDKMLMPIVKYTC